MQPGAVRSSTLCGRRAVLRSAFSETHVKYRKKSRGAALDHKGPHLWRGPLRYLVVPVSFERNLWTVTEKLSSNKNIRSRTQRTDVQKYQSLNGFNKTQWITSKKQQNLHRSHFLQDTIKHNYPTWKISKEIHNTKKGQDKTILNKKLCYCRGTARRCVPILHRFWDIARYWPQSAARNLPHLYLAPPVGVMSWRFRQDFWHRKTRVSALSYGVVSLILRLAIFCTTPTCDRQTDRHTMTANTALA